MATRRKPPKRQPSGRHPKPDELAAEELALADELERRSQEEEADVVAGWDKFLKHLRIRGKPIGAKKLQEMALREGVKPENNEFSRAIVAMREE
jgi:hypothetical protein